MINSLHTNKAEAVKNLSNPELKSLLSNRTETDSNKLEAFRRLRYKQARDLPKLSLEILHGNKADRNLKAEVVNFLAPADKNKYIKVLSRHLAQEDDLAVKSQIVRVLGERGTVSDLRVLDKISDVDTASAKRFIAYRYGISKNLWPQTDVVEYKGIKRNFKLITRTLDQAQKNHLTEDRNNPIPVHTLADVELTCQRQVIHIYRAKAIEENSDWEKIIQTPQIPFQFYFKHYSTPMLSHYLMIHPADEHNKFHINIVRPSGRQIYSGIGQLKKGKIYFSVFTVVGSNMPPIKVQGDYEPKSKAFNFTEAFSALNVKNGEKRVPTPID